MMSARKTKTVLLMVGILALTLAAFSCSQDETATQPDMQAQRSQPAAETPAKRLETTAGQQARETTSAAPDMLDVTGRVEQTEQGIVIATNVFKYRVEGEDLSAMIGKTVTATGTVEESEGQFTIHVLSVEEFQEASPQAE